MPRGGSRGKGGGGGRKSGGGGGGTRVQPRRANQTNTHFQGFEDLDYAQGLPPGTIDDTLDTMYPDGNPDLETD